MSRANAALTHVDVKTRQRARRGRLALPRPPARQRNRAATTGKPRNKHRNPVIGTAFVDTVIDDHSRVAYAEIHDDETALTAAGVLRRAVTWFAHRGVTTRRVLWRQRLRLQITPLARHLRRAGHHGEKDTALRPQTNRKIERFHQNLTGGWAFAKCHTTENARRAALHD